METAVELEPVNRQPRQVGQVGVTGTEVIDRQAYAHRVEPREDTNRFGWVIHRHALGELELQMCRRKTGVSQHLGNQRIESRIEKLLR